MTRFFLILIAPLIISAQDNNESLNTQNMLIVKSKTRRFLGKTQIISKQNNPNKNEKITQKKLIEYPYNRDIFPGISGGKAVKEKEDDSLAGYINRKLQERANKKISKTRKSLNTYYTKIKQFDHNGRKISKEVIAKKEIKNKILQINQKKDPIKQLKNGALLIRLKTNEHLINYYLSKNEIKKANAAINKQKQENESVILNFQKKWSFCPVYFFYSNKYAEIQDNNFESVFKDINGVKLNKSEIENLKNNFLISYFGTNPGNLNFNALVLTDQNLHKLDRSIPRYVRTYKGLWFLKRKKEKSIQILQKKIEFYWSRKQ